LSGEPISPILAKSLELSKKVDVKPQYLDWLKNELYGYYEYLRDKPEASEPEEFPNNPEYRKLRGEIGIQFIDEKTHKRRYEQVDKPIFLAQPAAEIEDLLESTRNSSEFLLNFPTSNFPSVKEFYGQSKVPVVCRSINLKSCVQQLRLKLHKYLNEDLMPKTKKE
jgi:hypothetical protein